MTAVRLLLGFGDPEAPLFGHDPDPALADLGAITGWHLRIACLTVWQGLGLLTALAG